MHRQYISTFNRIGLVVFTFLQFFYVRVIFGPRFFTNETCKDDMKVAYFISRCGGNLFFTIVLIVLICINNDGMDAEDPYRPLMWLPVGLCGSSIPFNILSLVVMND